MLPMMEYNFRQSPLLTDDNFLYFLGYPIESKDDNTDSEENPSIVIINLSENF